MTAHTITLSITGGWPTWTMDCPHDLTDATRPCWPCDEDGARLSTGDVNNHICSWRSWFDNCGVELIQKGAATWNVSAVWSSDEPLFTLEQPTPRVDVEPWDDSHSELGEWAEKNLPGATP